MRKLYTRCRHCDFINFGSDGKCSNCDQDLSRPPEANIRLSRNDKIPHELQDEISRFKEMGMYRRPPNDVYRPNALEEDEYILSILDSGLLYLIGVRKNDEKMRTGWFILTNKRVICYYRLGLLRGWTVRENIPYQEMHHAGVVIDWAGIKKNRFLKIDTTNNSFKFLFGSTTYKLCRRIMFFEADNKLPLDTILTSIYKRLPARTEQLQ